MENLKGMRVLGGTSLVFALLQSVCTAVLTINGIRVGIGLAALTASAIAVPIQEFHADRFRIPMLILAAVGAIVNLLVLAWIWHLRARPEAQWRRREIGPKQRRSERLQVALSVLTLVLVGVEGWLHYSMGHRPAAPAAVDSGHSTQPVAEFPIPNLHEDPASSNS